MLNSLEIQNFKNLKGFRLNNLDQVNLFTGKNNTGKSTILEAIAIYASKGDLNFIYQMLKDRGENYRLSEKDKNATEINLKALSSIFTNRSISYTPGGALKIGQVENTLFGEQLSSNGFVSLRIVKYYEDFPPLAEYDNPNKRRVIVNDGINNDNLLLDYFTGIEISSNTNSYIVPLDKERPYRLTPRTGAIVENFQFIKPQAIDNSTNGKLWDNVTLSEKEENVVNALKIIEPNIERIAFVDESIRERSAVIRLKENKNVIPLKSMGDGINRILTIILALVNADNGYLLIDELENGLHYSVQEKVWEIIFDLSQKLNVQVFATTHSSDCIYAFETALNNNNQNQGKLIRLENNNGVIQQTEYDSDELKIANKYQLETR